MSRIESYGAAVRTANMQVDRMRMIWMQGIRQPLFSALLWKEMYLASGRLPASDLPGAPDSPNMLGCNFCRFEAIEHIE